MDATELVTGLESNAADTSMLESAIQDAIAAGGGALDALLGEVVPLLPKGEAVEAVLKALDQAFRRQRESEAGPVLAWWAGWLAWKVAGDLVRAEFFLRAVGEAPGHVEEWVEFYRDFYASRGNWLRLEQFLADAAPKVHLSALDVKRALARTAHKFDNPSKELSYWQAVAQAAAGDPEADGELERLYTRLERWPSLADLLKERLKTVAEDDVAGKVAVLDQMLAIYRDRMHAEPKVLQTYQMILDVDPGNADAVDALLQRYEAAGRWPDYAKVLARKIEHATSKDEQIRLREIQANLMETRFANAMEALKAWEQILELAPERADVLDKLKDLYEKRRDFENLIRVRRMEADRIEDGAQRAAVLVELAVMATERLRKFPVAIELWEMVLAIDDANADALRNLEALYEREKDTEKLCGIVQRRIDLARGEAEQVQLLEKLAGIYGTRLNDAASALETWKRILAVQPAHERAKRELRARFLADHRWDELDWFLRKFGTPDELARTLESQIGSVADPEEKRALLYKLAAIWRDELAQPQRAVKDLEQVLALVPDDGRAASELIALYRQLGDWRRLPPVYDVAISKLSAGSDRRRLMIEAAEVHERHLGNAEAAFFWYVEAFKEDLLNESLRDELERLAGPSKNWDTYVAVLEQAAPMLPDDARKVATWLRVGQIHQQQLQDAEHALEAFKHALELEDDNRDAIAALEGLYRDRGDFEDLVGVLRRRLDLERRKEERKAIRFDVADILYKKLHRAEDAYQTYIDILADQPDETRAYDELSDLLVAERRFEDLLKMLKDQVEIYAGHAGMPVSVMADLHARIGLLTCALKGPGPEVVDAYSQALAAVPLHADALDLVARLLGVPEVRLEAVALLRGPYEALARWNDLADLMEIELLERGDTADTLQVLWDVHVLYAERVRDEAKRFRTLSRILSVSPGDTRAWDEIERAAASLGAWRDLAARYEEVAATIEETAVQVALRLRLAAIFVERVRSPEQAKRIYHEVLDADGANKDALDALEAIYETENDHPNRLDIYQHQYEVSPYDGERISYAFKMAGVLSDNLGDLDGGIKSVQLVLDMDPEYEAAWRYLDNLYTRAARWPDLARVLAERIRLAEQARDAAAGETGHDRDEVARHAVEAVALRLRLAETTEEKLEDLAGAVAVYRTIVEGDPENADALRQLERLFHNDAVRVLVAPILLTPYQRRQDWMRLVEVYDVLAEAAPDLDERLRHYDTIARIFEDKVADLDLAFRYRARAFRAAPERADLVDEVLRVGAAKDSLDEAILVLCEKVFDIEDELRRKETHRTIAKTCRDSGIDRELAKRHYSELLLMDPTDMDALDSLIALHREDDEVEPLVTLTLRKSDLVADASERAALLLFAGDLFAARLSKPDEAIHAYTGVLDIDPSNLRAIEALEALYEKAERWEDLVRVLGMKAENAATDTAKIEALRKKGLVQADRMGGVSDAIETFLDIQRLDPTDIEALRTLDRLYGATEDWQNLYNTLSGLHGLLGGDDRLTVHFRMGRLLERELSDPFGAVRTYSDILESHPDDKDTIDALEGMVRGGEAAEDAFRILAPALSERGEWERLFVVYEVVTEREEDVAAKVRNLLTMGEIAEVRMGEPIRSFDCYGKAFTADPLNRDALEKLEGLAGAHDMWDNVPTLLVEAAANIEGTPDALALRLRAGDVQRDRLADREGAAKTFEAVVSDIPDNRAALAALDALYQAMERWADLVRVLRAEIEATGDVGEKVAFQLRLADVAEVRREDSRAALDARREVLYLVPAQPDAVRELRRMFDGGAHRLEILELLEPIYRDGNSWLDLATVFEAALPDVAGDDEKKNLLLKLGEAWLDRLFEREAALGWFGKALALDPADDSLLVQVESLAKDAGAWPKLLEVLLQAATAAGEDARRIHLWHKASEVARDRLGDLQRAEAIDRWILDVDPNDRQALADLDAMYEAAGRYADLLHVLQRECEAAEFDDDRIGYHLRAGAVQRDRLNDYDGAVEDFRQVLRIDEMHRGALEALAELHEVREEHEALYKVLGTLADLAQSGDDRAALQRRMARIAEAHLGKKDEALALWEEISRVRADDVEALRELERLYAGKEDWTSFVDACERELPLAIGQTDRVVDLLRQVARAAEEFLGDGYQAQAAWRRILEASPADVDAMQSLRRLYREAGDLDGLAVIQERLAGTGALNPDEQITLCEERARLLTDELPRPDKAIEVWNELLQSRPEHREALETLDRLYEETNRIAECVAIVKRRASLADDQGARADLLIRAADLEADRLKDLRAAAGTLEEVLGFAPKNMDVSERLHGLYTRLEDWDRLGDVLLRRDGVLEDADARVQNLAELARVYEDRKGEKEAAFLILVKAADVNPADENTLAELWRLAQALANWGDYVDSLADVVTRMPDAPRLEHLARFGEVLWKNAGRVADAVAWYEKVVEGWPEHEAALTALSELYATLGRSEDLVRTLSKRVELTPDYLEKIQLQLQAAKVLENEIRDVDRALAAYKLVLDFDESNLEALESLARLHEARRDWEAYIGVVRALAPLVPDREIALRGRVAQVLEEKLQAPERAIQAYEEVVSLEPTNAVALDRLQALYGSLNDFKGLADVFERLLDLSGNDADRILFCGRLAMLWEEALGDKRKALDFDLRILDMDPADDEVFEACVRLLTDLEDWNELINLYEARVSRVKDPAARIAVLERVADVFERRMEDPNSAVSVHQRIVDLDATHVRSYSELARLFEGMESWEDVVQTLIRWKEHVDHDSEAVELLLRAATLVKERLENPDRALKLLGDVLRLDPANEAAAEKSRLIYAELEDWEKVADVFLAQEAHVASDERKAAIRAAAGDVFMNRLKDRVRAIQHYERALQLNPQLLDVALNLARAYVATEKWEKAEPLLDLLLGSPDLSTDPARGAEVHFQMGLCAEKLVDFDKAFREYQTAIKLRADHGPTVLGLARLYQRKQLWQLAKDHYQKAMDLGGEDLSEGDRAAIWFSLGEVSLELNELDEASRYLDKIEEGTANHLKALQTLINIAERKGDWSEVIRFKQAQIQTRTDPFERFALLLEVGDLYKSKLGNVYGAAQTYREAQALNPDAKVVLLRLFDLHLETGAIEDALFTLERLAKAEDAPEKRALHYVRMAALYQEKLGDDARAVEYLNLALDADPDRLEAFRAIDEILTMKKDWEAQAESYRQMLERLKGRGVPELEYRLYANLGEIYRSRLKRQDYAISAYAMAAKLRPEERRVHEILAQLYELTGDQIDKAVEEHRAIIAGAPLANESAESYKAMRRLYLQMKEFDKAFVVSGILTALGQADAQETDFFESNLEPGLPWFKGTLDTLRWESHLMSKDENTALGRVLQVLFQGLGVELGAKELKDVGLKKKNEVDLEAKLLFINVYKAVVKALGPLPHKLYRDDTPVGLKLEFLAPPALIVGSDMLTGHEEREVAFLLGRQMTWLHPMHFLTAVKNLTELKVFMAAVLKFCRPDTQITTGAEIVAELVKLIERRMPQQQKNQLSKLIDELAQKNRNLDFGAMFQDFFQSVERTSLRAGTLVCGNVDTIMRVIKGEDVSFSGLTAKERIEEVIRFAVSEDHYVLRRALGIAVEGTGA